MQATQAGKLMQSERTPLARGNAVTLLDHVHAETERSKLIESVVDDIELCEFPETTPGCGQNHWIRSGAREALLGQQEQTLFPSPYAKSQYAKGWLAGKLAQKRIDDLADGEGVCPHGETLRHHCMECPGEVAQKRTPGTLRAILDAKEQSDIGVEYNGPPICDGSGFVETPLVRRGIGDMIIEQGGDQFECPGCCNCRVGGA